MRLWLATTKARSRFGLVEGSQGQMLEFCWIGNDIKFEDFPVCDLEYECARKPTTRRVHQAYRAVHERSTDETGHMRISDCTLRPLASSNNFPGRYAGSEMRTNKDIRIEYV